MMSLSSATPCLKILLTALVAAALGCSDGATEPLSDTASELSGASDIGSAPGSVRSAATRAMKIRAGVQFANEVIPPPAPCLQLFNTAIEGHATHLGRLEGVGSTCITAAVAPDPDPPFSAPGPGPYLTATFDNPLWDLTAANGDHLHLAGESSVCVISLADDSILCEGSLSIIGGTGRFAGAVGEIFGGSINEDGMGPDDFEMSGWVRY